MNKKLLHFPFMVAVILENLLKYYKNYVKINLYI